MNTEPRPPRADTLSYWTGTTSTLCLSSSSLRRVCSAPTTVTLWSIFIPLHPR